MTYTALICAATIVGSIVSMEADNVVGQNQRLLLSEDDPYSIEQCWENWDSNHKKYLYDLCEAYDLDVNIMGAMIYNESNFTPDVVGYNTNGTRDWGYCQINDVCYDYVSQYVDVDNMNELLDPYKNIKAACELMAYHKKATLDDSAALLRYQVGEGAYRRMVQSGTYTTPTHQAVLKLAEKIK